MADFKTKIGNIRIKDGVANQMRMADDFTNFVSGLSGRNDVQSYAGYFVREISKEQIDASVRTSWISAKLHGIIPTDCIRAGWTHVADDADITAIEAEERRLQVNLKLRKALFLARKYGGSIMFMGVGNDDPRTPLDVNRVGKRSLRYLHVLSRYSVTIQNIILDPGSPYYGEPEEYLINTGDGRLFPVHASRVIRFLNDDTTEEDMALQGYWSDPLLMSLWSVIVNADTSQAAMAHLLNKMKVDTIKIPGLAEVFSTQESEDRFKKRLVSAQMFEGLMGIKLIGGSRDKDGPSEEWNTFQLNLAGMPELNNMFLQMCAGAGDTPYTRLVGKSAEGMSATGEGDQRNYEVTIKSNQELKLRPRHERLNDVLYRSAMGSSVPNGIWLQYNPLTVESDKEKAENAYKRAQATAIYNDSGLVPVEVMQEAVKGQLIESGEYPGIEQAYIAYAAGTLEGIVEEDEPVADDPLIPVDETGAPRLNRESRLFAANDMVAALLGQGHSAPEAVRLSDARPRPLYVQRKVLNVDEIKAWAREQGLPELNDDLHVTIAYSRTPVDWIKMGSTWSDAGNDAGGRLTINAGGPRVVEPLGDQAAVLMFASSDLAWRHTEMVREGASWDYPDYTPHISLVRSGDIPERIEPYRGKIELGMEIFEELRD